jgi:5-methylcytosine-specific restriction endonuclease McrA
MVIATRGKLRRNRSIVEAARREFDDYRNRRASQRRVLVINSNYQPITTTPFKKAINKLWNGTAVVVLPPGDDTLVWQELDWIDWAKLVPREGESVLAAVERVFKIPEIIKTMEFGDLPQRRVKLSRRAIYKRDGYTCQYCGKRAPKNIDVDDLSIDHVLPKAQGGKTSWDNVALACTDCNRKKADRTPEEAHMRLSKQPQMPHYDILQGRLIRVDSWQHFLGDCYWEVPLKED